MAQKVEAHGDITDKKWDDGSEWDAVTKIQVQPSYSGIYDVQFVYVKHGKHYQIHHGFHRDDLATHQFVINHPEEHLVSVQGWYVHDCSIQGLKFKSNQKTSDVIGYEKGIPFTLQVEDKKIIGFHGFAGNSLDALGAYFVPLTS